MPGALEAVFGRYALQFFADSSGLKLDMEKLELQATKQATHIERSFATGFTGGVEKARESVGSLTEYVGRGMGQLVGYLVNPMVAIGALAAGFGAFAVASVKSAIEFEHSFRQVRLVLGDTGKNLDELKAKVLAITPSMASAGQEAESMAKILGVGFTGDDAIKILDNAAKLSRVTGIDLRSAVEGVTEALLAYGLGASEASRVTSVLLGVAKTAGGPEGMGEVLATMGRVNVMAHELGLNIEDVNAALVMIKNQGLPAGRSAMVLATALTKATSSAQEFREAGIDIGKTAKEKGIIGVFDAIATLAGRNQEDLKKLGFEGKAATIILSMTGEKAGLYAENLAKIKDADIDVAVKQMTDLTSSTMDLNKAWEEFKIAVGETAVPIIARLAEAAAGAAKTLAHPVEYLKLLGTGAKSLLGSAVGLFQGAPVGAGATGTWEAPAAAPTPAGAPAVEGEQRLSDVQRASLRKRIEDEATAVAARLKIGQDAQTKEIALDKQLAEARKATGLELLAFDRQTLDVQFNLERSQRENRLKVIAKELPLLKDTIAAEKAERMKLLEERSKLQVEEEEGQKTHQKQLTLLAAREVDERRKVQDAEFAARKTMGQTSLQEEVDRQTGRGRRFAKDWADRIQADAEGFKAAQDLVERLFAHEEALGRKSLQDAIDQAKAKGAAAVAGSETRMKAEEDVYKKEEELRNKRQTAALGILGEVQQRLEAKGMTGMVTRADVERELQDLQQERGQKAQVAQTFAAGGAAPLADVIAGYKAAGELNTAQQQMVQLGGPGDILAGGAQVGAGPLTQSLGALGDRITQPIAGIGDSFGKAMDAAFKAVDDGLTKIEDRVNNSSSRIAKTIQDNLEQWFVDKLMREALRN